MQFSDLDLNKTYSYADYLNWTFDERIEIIKGKLFNMGPSPAPAHQELSGIIFYELFKYLKGKPCKVYTAPFDVRLPKRSFDERQIFTVVQPDISVICDLQKIDEKGCLGAPDIVIEILSPGNNQTELQNKYQVYEEAGVKEYWLVVPKEKALWQYILNTEVMFIATRPFTIDDLLTSDSLPGFSLKIDDLFRQV